jgi:hypothetical protein
METLPSSQVVMPFGKVNIWNEADGSKKVRAYILVERPFEGAKTGIAIDGSASLRPAYGYIKGWLDLFLPFLRLKSNVVEEQSRKISAYLAKFVDVNGKTDVIYWATNSGNDGIEEIGELSEAQCPKYDFNKPKKFGTQTRLAPALKYFTDKYKSAKWGMFVFITDGVLDDLENVKTLTAQLAKDISAKKRKPVKLILLGVGPWIEEKQMQELDDLDTGTNVDLWDHKIASEMSQVAEIFTEVVDEKVILAENGLIRDAKGKVVKEYRDTGLPALLEFILPKGASSAFTLEYGGQIIRQPLP